MLLRPIITKRKGLFSQTIGDDTVFHPFYDPNKKQRRIDEALKKRARQPEKQESAEQDETQSDDVLSASLDENCRRMQELFRDNDALIMREIQNLYHPELVYRLFYSDGMTNTAVLQESVIRPLIQSQAKPGHNLIETLQQRVITAGEVQIADRWHDLIDGVVFGSVLLFLPRSDKALLLPLKKFEARSVTEPDSEKILSGPREGFNENLLTNLTLLRRKIRTNDLKLKYRTFGRRTQTKACLCYLDSIVNHKVLALLEDRLNQIDMDGVLDTNYLSEMIRDSSISPFRTTGYTERPDVVAAKLLEGRIAVFLDGTPVVLTVPYLFIENFQSSEDYYLNFFYTSFSRLLRMLGFFMTITVPGFYIAIVAFHQEMLPTPLLINIASERQGVPLPAAAEAFIMLIVFDILRETGARMPSNTGQALSIVGALVIGQAAVEARLVAAPMIIIIGITGITSLLIPKMNAPIIFIRLFILFASSVMGLFGMMLALCGLLIHMLNLDSFGVSQLTPTGKLQFQELKDKMIRAPWWLMTTRPKETTLNTIRMKTRNKAKP